jgi:hypothetical protein
MFWAKENKVRKNASAVRFSFMLFSFKVKKIPDWQNNF